MPTIQNREATLYYEVHGEGHPVFFIHGGGGNTLAWYQQVPHFSRSYRVITVDLRGHKSSVCPQESVHPRFMADDICAIMDAEGLSQAAFVCQSLGAWAGLPIAVKKPERVSCLFINASPTPAFSNENWDVLRRAGGIFTEKSARGDSGVGWNRTFIKEQPEKFFLHTQIKLLSPPFNAATMLDESNKIYPAEFGGYEIPTLVTGGAHDDFLNPEAHKHVASLIPGASEYTFTGAGHFAYLETPDEFNSVLGAFLQKHC